MFNKPVKIPGQKPPVGAYSPGMQVLNWIFVSGQGPLNPDTHEIVGTTIEEQTTITLQNVQRVLRAAGADMDDCVKVNVHLLDIKDFDRFNAVYKTFFRNGFPARTTVQSGLWNNIRVEIDAIAYREHRRD